MQLALVAALGLSAARVAGADGWVYADRGEKSASAAAQERTWGGLCAAGQEQSPVNIDTAQVARSSALPSITTHFTAELKYTKNTGHGFQLFETSNETHDLNSSTGVGEVDALGTPKGYSMIGGSRYNFYQVHWHTPSENTVDNRSFPLEAHFVHQLDDPALHGTYHRLAVIGLLYELGECNDFLDQFWSQFPSVVGMTPYSGPDIDFNTKLTQELSQGYYHWYGSLTTPPCMEGVSWNLLLATETVCKRQISELVSALSRSQRGIGFNNRVVQPLNHRIVTVTAGDWGTEPAPGSPAAAAATATARASNSLAVACMVVSATSLLVHIFGLA